MKDILNLKIEKLLMIISVYSVCVNNMNNSL